MISVHRPLAADEQGGIEVVDFEVGYRPPILHQLHVFRRGDEAEAEDVFG
jgi:hypothetical protein